MKEIVDFLFSNQDLKYRDFNSNLTPTVEKDYVIGVRTPILKKYAKEIKNTELAMEFLKELPHRYFEENQLHAFLINEIKDYTECMRELEIFLPFVDNWATCDQTTPKALKKNPTDLLEHINIWLSSEQTYTIRYGIKRLMDVFLDDNFDVKFLERVSKIRSDEYYVNMMIAWYFATALAKQYDNAIPFLEKHMLADWTHRKTIQKACESFRISDVQKEYLRTLK